jgi:hypothetical protein
LLVNWLKIDLKMSRGGGHFGQVEFIETGVRIIQIVCKNESNIHFIVEIMP